LIILHTADIYLLAANIRKRLSKKNEVSSEASCESKEYVDVCLGISEGMTQWRNKSIIIANELLIV